MTRLAKGGAAAAVVALAGALAITFGQLGPRLLDGGPGPVKGPIPAPAPATVAAAAGLKIAFLGDSGSSEDFRQVLKLVRAEKGDAVVHLGDAIYSEETPAQFWGAVDGELGHEFPYFLAQGNHDLDQWPAMAAHAFAHVQASGAVTEATSQLDPRLDVRYRGVSLTLLGQEARDDDPRRIIERFSRDPHIWKICAWHKNQEKLQVGGKGNEMGWGVYESCRRMGAMIQTGHEHSYHRTKTLTNMAEQQVDATCPDARLVCVRPGAVPVFVSGLGGRSVRDQERCLPALPPYGCQGEWAFIYTANQGAQFGALFVAFAGEGADPRKARGYFKTVGGRVIDEFDLVAQ
jgi:hypothetical protein